MIVLQLAVNEETLKVLNNALTKTPLRTGCISCH